MSGSRRSIRGKARSRYTLLHRLGDGGMGVVYAAMDNRLGRPVALKFAPPHLSLGGSAVMVLREAEAVARVRSPHVCQLHDVDEHGGRPCLVLELLEGADLRQAMASSPFPAARIVKLCRQVAEALDATHSAGLVHQDIKPANLFLTNRGDLKVLDFGLAVDISAPPLPTPMAADPRDSLYGTVNYIAPERVLRQPPAPRADLFSLGAVMYEMATGRRPFAGATPGETILNVLDYEPPSIRMTAPDLPAALDVIVRTLLAKDPERRYRGALELGAALGQLQLDRRMSGRRSRAATHLKGDSHASIDGWNNDAERCCA